MLINNTTFNDYVITQDVEDTDECILIKARHKHSNTQMSFFGIYLPPENSVYGDKADNLFELLVNKLYDTGTYDLTVMMGDFNCRIGNKCDYVERIDDVPTRGKHRQRGKRPWSIAIEFHAAKSTK